MPADRGSLAKVLTALLAVGFAACDDGGGAAPAADATAAPVDARLDAATADATRRDAAPDAARADAAPDASAHDATPTDAARVDAAPDATPPDASPPIDAAVPRPYPAPGDGPRNRGPGGPATAFDAEQLYEHCAYLDVGPDDRTEHRNLVVMYDGYLMMPWAPEWGRNGGLTFFDVSNPCAPSVVGHGTTDLMRETHSVGFSAMGGRWAAVNHSRLVRWGGVLFWDIADIEHPTVAGAIEFDDFFYPDAYARLVLSVFWQAPYLYAAGADSGIYIVDASDPRNPVLVNQHRFHPVLRAGQVIAVGNLLIVTPASGTHTALLDISDPANPQPLPGGQFLSRDEEGEPRESYFSNLANGFIYYARKQAGGGLMVHDIRDPLRHAPAGGLRSDGNGGYVFVKDHYAFTGESSFAGVYDISDHANIREVTRLHLEGDLDTATPIGNVVMLAVDDRPVRGQATAVVPYLAEPDTTPPRVTWAWPADGATGLALTSRFGVTFNEHVDVKSAWEGSVRLYIDGTDPALTRVDGHLSVQETIINFWPTRPLQPNTTYRLDVPAGGVADYNGNRTATDWTATFTTRGE